MYVQPEAEFLEEVLTKVLGVFFLAIDSHIYIALPRDLYFLKLTQPLTISLVRYSTL
jgi:hypothetical protein